MARLPERWTLSRLCWPLLAALAGAAAVVPLWSSRFLPFQDAPQHLASIRVLADYGDAAAGFSRWFELDLAHSQYTGFYGPAALLARVLGAENACRLLLSLVALALPLASWMLLSALGHDTRLAVLAPAVFHTTPLYIGFFNFVASVPVSIACVALTERELTAPRTGRALALAVLSTGMLWLHPSGVGIAVCAGAVLAVTSALPLRQRLRGLLPLLPAVVTLALWALSAPATRPEASRGAGGVHPFWQPFSEQLRDLGRFGNVLPGRVDELFVLLLIALWVAVQLVPGRTPLHRSWRLPLLAAGTCFAFLVAPSTIGYISFIHLRALPFLAVTTLDSARIAPGRATGLLLAAAVALQLGYSARLVAAYRAFDAEAAPQDLEQVLRRAEPGRRLLALMYERKSDAVHFEPYLHFGLYYELLRGGRARFNFGELSWMPVRLRKDRPPQRMPPYWEFEPAYFDWERAREDTDYVLTRSTDPRGDAVDDPEPGPERGAGFTLLVRAGRWSLYAPEPPAPLALPATLSAAIPAAAVPRGAPIGRAAEARRSRRPGAAAGRGPHPRLP